MTLEEVIGEARTQSVQALQARAAFVSDYWAWRSYQASRLPSLSLYGTLGSFDRSLRLLQDPQSGELLYTSNYNMENSIGLRARQNITFTGDPYSGIIISLGIHSLDNKQLEGVIMLMGDPQAQYSPDGNRVTYTQSQKSFTIRLQRK